MPPRTIKMAIRDSLEDLSKTNFAKFISQLLDRRQEPRVKRSRVEDASYLVLADVLVTTFTELTALDVTVEILREIDCCEDAERLVEQTKALTSESRPSGGASGEHFVDKHRVKLTQRVANIAPILDNLLDKKVIQQESYDKIRAIPTTQEKMREIYCVALRSGTACKDIFYKILEDHEQFLIADLKKNE